MDTVEQLAALVAESRNTTVALYGESGCGKGMLARAIHSVNNGRSSGRFVVVNCAAIPDNLLESELFGHKRGAFTGAESDRDGKFSVAKNGTIFLDEIGEISLSFQSKLLRVIEERTFEKVGSNKTEAVECRIIVATNRNLPEMVASGSFRDDLFHRINVFPLTVPPLRDRKDDLPLLCENILKDVCLQMGRPVIKLSASATQRLLNYHWPGNIRELRNCLERAIIISSGRVICLQHILLDSVEGEIEPVPCEGAVQYNLTISRDKLSLKSLDELIMSVTLERCNGNKTLAAKTLKIGRTAYYS